MTVLPTAGALALVPGASAGEQFPDSCSRHLPYGTLTRMAITTSSVPVHNNFINGSWVPSTGGDVFENRNPANTADLIGVFQRSTRQDVEDAIDAARRAYPSWRLVPAPRRADLLFRAA